MRSTAPSTAVVMNQHETIEPKFRANGRADIGHNNSPPDHYPNEKFVPYHLWVTDYGKALRLQAYKSDLPTRCIAMVAAISDILRPGETMCWPGIKTLSDMTNIPYGTAKRMYQVLRQWEGLVIKEARGRRGNEIHVNITEEAVIAAIEAHTASKKWRPLAGSLSDPPRTVAGSPSDLRSASRITPEPVGGSPTPVDGSPSEPLLKTKEASRRGDFSDEVPRFPEKGRNVVPITDDADWVRRKLEPFGEHGHRWAEEHAKFLGINIPEAVAHMEMAALSHGAFNVVEAIREASAASNVKSPKGFFNHLLTEQSKHGKREMPKTVAPPEPRKFRMLTMAERCF